MRIFSRLWIFLLATTVLLPGCASLPDRLPAAVSGPSPAPGPSSTPLPVDSMEGDLRTQIERLEDRMPRAGSNGYVIPAEGDAAAFAGLVLAVESGDLLRAGELAAANRYRLVRYTDRGDGDAASYLLQELTPIRKGWGLYAFRENPAANVIVEAPHPLADVGTPGIALDVYRTLEARALLVAGAHRDANRDGSADVVHVPGSVFQSIHNALVGGSQGMPEPVVVLQIHGFASGKHSGYPQVVIGYDRQAAGQGSALAAAIRDALVSRGLEAGLCDGRSWEDLCGTQNILSPVPEGAVFIHFELNEAVRSDDVAFLDALEAVFASGASHP
jgi:hypothetical protein